MTHRVLVTGTSGVLGREAVIALERMGHSVVAHEGRRDGDLTDPATAAAVVAKAQPSAVINTAGLTYGTAAEIWAANFLIPVRLADALGQQAPTARLVLAGSAAEYGLPGTPTRPLREDDPCTPNSDYGLSKLAAGRAVAVVHPSACAARIFNILADVPDPRSLLGRVATGYAMGDDEPAGSGEVRDWVSSAFAGMALALLATLSDVPPVMNVCSGVGRTPSDILRGRPSAAASRGWSVGDPELMRATTGLQANSA